MKTQMLSNILRHGRHDHPIYTKKNENPDARTDGFVNFHAICHDHPIYMKTQMLSNILRHGRHAVEHQGIKTRTDGFVNFDAICALSEFRRYNKSQIMGVIKADSKDR
jgi:RNA:NAD 2'-phosphotransferase (TPT1/KptA family)